ncbi:hypothetical protein BBJ28_00009715 [Nothophytophthora sp. Chile5]|nr:hypothetical protein BBJ28_00009715 [Nothophytophthora sp. Chile5]
MGFKKEDAEASVKHVGDDPEQCMVWIVSTLEERQFTEQLNQASIQSEQSKRDEEKRVKKQEREALAHAKAFTALFPTVSMQFHVVPSIVTVTLTLFTLLLPPQSFMLSSDSSASRLKQTLDSTIGQVDAKSYLREILTKLLKLEGQAIRWYKQAAKSYMLELAARLESALGSHDVVSCCACVSANDVRSSEACCAFVRALFEEERTLTKALFEMPSNHGGVPLVFLQSDEAMQFSLEDDGFEVLEDVS